jgi:phosphate starvation-inducible PhoH-like protein
MSMMAVAYPDDFVQALDGVDHQLLDRLHERHGIRLNFRGNELHVDRKHQIQAREIVDGLYAAWQRDGHIDASLIEHQVPDSPIIIADIRARTEGQLRLVSALQEATIAFAIGPAGTGKTLLAIAHAARQMNEGVVDKIVLTRPVVESGEKLGFLPGTLEEKIDPYLRPLFDALQRCLPGERMETRSDERPSPGQARAPRPASRVEVAPLAYMRGRTLTRSVIVLDEAQNTTPEQLKMLLTRIGEGSQIIVTGDPAQSDLGRRNGLADFLERYERSDRVRSLAVVHLGREDIVRHWMIGEILSLYDEQ